MIATAANQITATREQLIAGAVRELAAELRLIDPSDYIALLTLGHVTSLDDIISSSIELYFKPHALQFCCTGDCSTSWGAPPIILLDFEFSHDGVFVFFRLHLHARKPTVALHSVSFEKAGPDPGANTQALEHALANARLSTAGRAP